MSAVSVPLTAAAEVVLRERASRAGLTLEAFLAEAATAGPMRYVSAPAPTPAEFARLLRDLAAGPPLPVLPADFSRANLYDDHD